MSGCSWSALGRRLAVLTLGLAFWAAGAPNALGQDITAEQAGARAAKAYEQLQKLGLTDMKLGEYLDSSRTLLDEGQRVKAPAWRIVATNDKLEERDLPPGKEIWSVYVDIYTQERMARLAWEGLTSSTGGMPVYFKPPAPFMTTPGGMGVVGIARTRIYGAVRCTFRCGNVICRVEILTNRPADATSTPQESWGYRTDLAKKKAEQIHQAFHESGVCAGGSPQQMTTRPCFSGPGTTVDVDILGEFPVPNAKIDFGPGIEQYTPAQVITSADEERPGKTRYGYRCHLKLSPNVPLGERKITVTGAEGVPHIAMFSVKPLVLVIDIDGLRHDVLMQCLTGRPVATPSTKSIAPNLHRIFGDVTGQRQEGALRLTQFERGFVLDDAITIFPSYTFPSQASFVMGTEPGVHGLPGNAIFDRMTKTNYGFDGSEKASSFVGQVLDVYGKGLAGQLLRGDSVYSALLNAKPPQKALSLFHQFRGGLPAESYVLPDILDQALFVPAATTHHYDRNATEELEKRFKGLPVPTSATLSRLSEWFSLIWLYLPGVDHYAHASEWSIGLEQAPDAKVKVDLSSDTPTKELSAYVEFIDPSLDRIVDFLEDYPGTIVMIVSDHGHTDTREAHDISWEPIRKVIGDTYALWDTGKSVDDCDIVARLNSGVAHIYVNKVGSKPGARCGEHWNEKPDYFRVRDVANRFESWNDEWHPIPGLEGKPPYFDLILARQTERDGWNGPYYVYDSKRPDPFETIQSYLTRTNNEFGVRLGWSNTPQDIDFIAGRINAMSCERSGDVIVLPHYPPPARLRKAGESYYHFTGGNYASQHGSLSMDDMNMSFAVAQLGCVKPDNLLSVLRQTIANPARPRILDVSSTAAGFCGVSFRGKAGPSPNAGVVDTSPTGQAFPAPPVSAAHTPPASGPAAQGPQPKPPAPKEPVAPEAERGAPKPASPELGQLAAGAGKGQVTPAAEKQSWGQADLANGFREQGKLPEAEAAMLRALQLNPNAWYLWDGLSDLYLQDQAWPDAETSLRAASRLAPKNGRLHLKLAQALMMGQKREEAIAEAREALRLGADGAKQLLEALEKSRLL